MSSRTVQNVMYVVSRFPALTMTFVAYEMEAIQNSGINVQIASVWQPDRSIEPQTVEKQFCDKVFCLSLSDPALWLHAIQQLFQKPQLLILLFHLFIGHMNSIYGVPKFLANMPKGLYLGYLVRKNHIQHIHAHFLSSPATVAIIASRASGIPYTVTIHAFDIYATNQLERNSAVPLKCEHASANVVISKFNLQYIQNKWPNIKGRYEVIYNGIDTELFRVKAKSPRDSNTFRILTNGRLVYSKGHSFLIEAVAKILEKGRKVSLAIIGQGPYESNLRDLVNILDVNQHVEFLGIMPHEEIVKAYSECDLFVLACAIAADGDMDGLPTVLIESLAMEIPTISTQVSGVPEIIDHKITGLCVPPHNTDALAEAIEYMMDQPVEAQLMAAQGRKLVVEKFNRAVNSKILSQIWQDT